MNTSRKTMLNAVVLILAAYSWSSCQKDPSFMKQGTPIAFSAVSYGSPSTRTSYSGETSDGKERIDWHEGDKVRIYSSSAETDEGRHYGDYVVILEGKSSGAVSETQIDAVDLHSGLTWSGGETEGASFLSVYPSPSGSGNGDSFGASTPAGTLTGHIPSSQGYATVSESAGVWSVNPDMQSQYMAAKTTLTGKSDFDRYGRYGPVFLRFYPLTTAVRFTIKNDTKQSGEAGDMYVDAVSLISEGTRIYGGFTADLDSWDGSGDTAPSCAAVESGAVTGQEVKLDLSGQNVKLEDGDKLTFTLFLLPIGDVNDLTFKIYRHDKDGKKTWMSTKLAYNDALRTGVLFPNHKLTEVEGVLIPDGARWTVKYSPEVDPWGSQDQGGVEPGPEINHLEPFVTSWTTGVNTGIDMQKYNYTIGIDGETNFGHEGVTGSSLSLTSSREYNHSVNPVVWYIEYEDEASGTWKVAKNGEQMNGLVTLEASGLDSENGELVGKGDKTLSLTVAAAPEPSTSKTHTARLADATPKGSESTPYDLSMYTIYGDARTRAKTANCYIVKSKGWYAFPMVYGNAIDDNVAPAGFINVNAYNPGGETDPTNDILTRFKNYRGQGIRQPYIETDLAEIPVPVGGTAPSIGSASVVWQDAEFIDNCSVLSVSAAEGKGLTSNACGYIMFHVNDNICQGNAVIALKDGEGKTIWSWHIWITDNELDLVTFKNYGGQDMKMLPVNLGWVDSDNTSLINYYEGKSVKLRVVQEGSNIVKEITVTRRPESTASHEEGASPYYQWGRKDPFNGGSLTTVSNSETTNIAYSIQHPDTFVVGGYYYYSETIQSNPSHYYNLWSALNKGLGTASSNYGSKTIKTVYDPCPPGFQIPQGTAYTGLTTTGANSGNSGDFKVSGPFSGGWYFNTGAGDETNFFKAGGHVSDGGALSGSGESGSYWTSVPQTGTGTEITALGLGFSGSAVNVVTPSRQSTGCSVRPVMEEYL